MIFRAKKCLPGPFNLPIIGYLHKLDPAGPHLTLTKLVQKYGPVYRLKLGSINTVVIADAKILKKLLAKDETLGRPPLYIFYTVFDGKGILSLPIEQLKDQRKFVTNFLRTIGASRVSPNKKTCEALIRKHVEEFVQVFKSPNRCVSMDPSEYVSRCVSNIAGMILLGKSFSLDDKTVTDLAENLDKVIEAIAFGGPLNFLPFLRFLPMFRKTLTSLKKSVHIIRDVQKKLINECQESMSRVKTDVPTSLIQAFLIQMSRGSPEHIYNHNQLHYLLFDIYIAFTETTKTSFGWILLYLAQYEEVQNKIRQELLEVVQDKTVEVDDFVNLHYTKAAIAEVARIRTVAPFGMPQWVSANVCVEGYTIPKDTMIMPLLWAIHMDPKVYKEPEEFRPERFLDDNGKFIKPESFLPFQTGKRMCIGEEIATMIMYIFVVIVVKNFKLAPPDFAPIDFTGITKASLAPKPQEIMFTKI
ncbi:hypothetical protein Zmor_022912 [Zophobas morio]|uniref:Uncharacterized protein n=1 Tax=Zophobas morio TaxID=2755281 RepID=A0AA38HYN8_9CUCU|nr:hypothetical protein Zmor_022912 [Zophobas morio]